MNFRSVSRIQTALALSLIMLACTLCASAATANVSVAPTSINFGTQNVGTSSSPIAITLTNLGNRSVALQSASLSSTAFKLSGWSGSVSLPAGGKLTLQITFTPTAATTYSASLTVAGNRGINFSVPLSGTGISSTPASVAVGVSPASAALQVGATQQFSAAVSGTTNTGVTWSVNGVQGGNSTVGTVSTSGLYTAPSAVPSTGSVTVTATSQADATKSASATVSIAPAPTKVTVAISPTSASVQGGATQQFTAAVSGTTNTAVNWSVNGTLGGSATLGTISSSGLYTAPTCSSTSSVTITAQSVYDSTSSATAAVSLTAASLSSTDRYVATTGSDANDGSACRPWLTINHAASLAQPGWTIHVAPGTYNETVVTNTSGNSSAHIRYISNTRWGAKISSLSGTDSWTNNGDYVDIVGFDITGATSNHGILNWASYVRILGNHVHDIPVPIAGGCNQGGAGIDNAQYTSSHNDVIGNWIDHIGTATAGSCAHGIYIGMPYGTTANNVINNVTQYGIQLYHYPGNYTISNNTVFNAQYGGIVVASDSITADYITVTNNILFNDTYYGIREMGTTGTHNVYANNLEYGNSTNVYLQNGLTPTNNIVADPQFVNYQANGSGNYHLSSTSPAINSGTSQGPAPTFDFDGGVRPTGGAWDMGAYEYSSTPAAWPLY